MISASEGAHVLYVDDEEADRFIMARVWQVAELPGRLTILPDGRDLPAYLAQCERGEDAAQPDLILLKWQLRTPHGSEVLASLRGHPRWSRLPVVVLCDGPHDSDIRQAYALGANAVSVLPPGGQDMMETMQGLHRYWFGLSRLPPRIEAAAPPAQRQPVVGW